MTYEQLLIEADKNKIITKEKPLRGHNGRIKGNRIAIKQDIAANEKACVLAEELGHYYTSVGNILDMNNTSNRKQEHIARLWAYNKLVGLTGIIRAYEANCQSLYEMAEFLDISQEFLCEALKAYRNKYGAYATVDNYAIYFIPTLGVIKLL